MIFVHKFCFVQQYKFTYIYKYNIELTPRSEKVKARNNYYHLQNIMDDVYV